MSADMHRSPWFFVLCLAAAFLAGLVTREDLALEAASGETETVATSTVQTCPPPDTRNWVAKGFDAPVAKGQP